MRYMQAIAESSFRVQADACRAVVEYCHQVRSLWRPLVFIHHVKHDETPVKVLSRF